jgi:3-deoxy-D-manno-octulosonic-acid transferase
MDFYYAAADVALIGGSFVPRGGQNLIEACAAGVPVVLGPSMVNFAEAARLAVAAGAARQADGAAAAMQEVTALLADARARASMGEAGRELCRTHRGATRRHLDLCREVLRAPARG